jgi:tetracycline repressor-like protein
VASVIGDLGLAYLGPQAMRLSDDVLGVFEAAGFGLAEADLAMSALVAYVVGTATAEAASLTAAARSGRTEQEWVERVWPAAEAAAQKHPRLQRLYAAQQGDDPSAYREGAFAYGLDRLLDGLATRTAGKRG